MSTRTIVRHIAPPQATVTQTRPDYLVEMPHLWPAATAAGLGLAVYLAGIAFFSSVVSFLVGTALMVLGLALYIGAMLNAFASLPVEAVPTATPAVVGNPVVTAHEVPAEHHVSVS